MGRNKAEKNGLAPPIYVRLPFPADRELRKLAKYGEVGKVARRLILEALDARDRNKAREMR
jgi:hypothetical protein